MGLVCVTPYSLKGSRFYNPRVTDRHNINIYYTATDSFRSPVALLKISTKFNVCHLNAILKLKNNSELLHFNNESKRRDDVK